MFRVSIIPLKGTLAPSIQYLRINNNNTGDVATNL